MTFITTSCKTTGSTQWIILAALAASLLSLVCFAIVAVAVGPMAQAHEFPFLCEPSEMRKGREDTTPPSILALGRPCFEETWATIRNSYITRVMFRLCHPSV